MSLSPVQKATAPEAVVQQQAVVAEKVAVQSPVAQVAQKALAEAPVAAEKSLCDRFCTWIKELFDRIFCCFKSAKKEETKAEETPAAKANQVAADALQQQVVAQTQTEQPAQVVVAQTQAEQSPAPTGDVPPPPPAPPAAPVAPTTVAKNKEPVQEVATAQEPVVKKPDMNAVLGDMLKARALKVEQQQEDPEAATAALDAKIKANKEKAVKA
jgi:hypothetical protein